MNNTLCIYHGHCDDGFAAAWCVRAALGDQVEFYPGVYQKDPPDVADRDVIMVDFSYKRPVIDAIAKAAKSLLILDHHKTAAEDLAGMQAPFGPGWDRHQQNVYQDACEGIAGMPYALFDMARSGAGLAWDFFHPEEPQRPMFINYVEDRDLWRKSLPGGDEFTIALRSYPQDFEIWDMLVNEGADALIAEGKSIQRYYRLRVEELKRSAYRAVIPIPGHRSDAPSDVACVRIAVANAPYFAASEVAGELALMEGATFGACYFEVRPGEWQYSLRSRGDFDVGAFARIFGGGGHPGAAGFTVPAPVHEIA
jgi:oligoribonuclease NrnB/cAMP/cGMP phosphodiesterase (DHH superfamily)